MIVSANENALGYDTLLSVGVEEGDCTGRNGYFGMNRIDVEVYSGSRLVRVHFVSKNTGKRLNASFFLDKESADELGRALQIASG